MTPAEWYRQNYPSGPSHNERCLAVLGSWQALYNINRTGVRRTDGGFRVCADGVEVHLPGGVSMATYDNEGLTRLVLAAHRHQCRVELSCRGRYLVLLVFPRKPGGTAWYDRHPTLADLAEQIAAQAVPS